MKAVEVEARQCNRLLLLYTIYANSPTANANVRDLAHKRGLKNGKFEEAFQYLVAEKLIINITAGFEYQYHLSHNGIKAAEWAIMNPLKRNEEYSFPPLSELAIEE